LALIVVDNPDVFARPAELVRPVGQGVLASGGLLMVGDLLRRGLADLNDRLTS
jgi:hypothetical protein